MGLFGKKDKGIEVRAAYYDGELPNFVTNHGCKILLKEDVLVIKQITPVVEVTLERNRLQSIEILAEIDYMPKYKGTVGKAYKKGEIPKEYYVIHYISKDGESKHIDFWGTSTEGLKMMKMREQVISNKQPSSYDI